MIKERKFREAGWVYLMAICLAKRAGNHSSVSDAAQWLEENGFDREAQTLNTQTDPVIALAKSKKLRDSA